MSNQKQRDPEVDFGYYASIPRLVRTGYEQLTPVQKWLYTCLKDLCGDKGTCYRTLRVLSEETKLSTGLLSESIPLLHSVGLVHAEKKRRTTGGKEVWHISIVDIWAENGNTHPTKRSQNEHTQENQNVHKMNVHNVNDTPTECSQNERECSQNRDRSNNSLSNNIEERTSNIASSTSVPDASPSLSEILQRLEALEQENASLKMQLSQQHPPVEQTLPSKEPTPAVEPAPDSGQANTNHIANGTTSESEEEAPAPPPVIEAPAAQDDKPSKGKGSRKPNPPKEKKVKRTEEENARITAVFDCLDKVAQEALEKETNEPSDFTFGRPETNRVCIHDLLQGRSISPKYVHMVFMELWDRPKGKDGFEWKRNMSVAAFCRNYDNALLSAMGKARAERRPEQQPELISVQEQARAALSPDRDLGGLKPFGAEYYRPLVKVGK